MRASCCAERAVLAAALCLSTFLVFSQTGISSLEPAFRLPAGGLPLAPPVLDASGSPALVWLLSEDHSLYGLTEAGSLIARIPLEGSFEGEGYTPFLAVDPFARVLLVSADRRLSAYTRMGALAWRTGLGEGLAWPPAFGSDGRSFVLSASSLVCLNPAGLRLWSLALPSPPSCPPGVDGRGYPCAGLADGRLLVATPYGQVLRILDLGSPPGTLLGLPAARAAGQAASGAAAQPAARPLLAAGMRDGRILLVGEGGILAVHASASQALGLAWDGKVLYSMDSGGEALALSAEAKPLWKASTGCVKGGLFLFGERLVVVGQGRAVSLSLDGEVFRELKLPGSLGSPLISPAGLAFSSGRDWILAAYRFERPLGPLVFPKPEPYPNPADLATGDDVGRDYVARDYVARDYVARVLLFDPLASDSSRQLKRLAEIEKSLRSGTIGADEPESAAFCAAVATGAFDRDLSPVERRRRGNPLARSRACYLLGDLGSPDYRVALFAVLGGDSDPAVRIAACEALASMSVDGDGLSMEAFLRVASRPIDDATALAVASAIEAMELRSGSGPGEDGLRTLIKLTSAPYGQSVRDRALTALGRISGTIR
jgi:hypothetical protein